MIRSRLGWTLILVGGIAYVNSAGLLAVLILASGFWSLFFERLYWKWKSPASAQVAWIATGLGGFLWLLSGNFLAGFVLVSGLFWALLWTAVPHVQRLKSRSAK